jgi:hypothetical protein
MTGHSSRATFNLSELQGNCAPATSHPYAGGRAKLVRDDAGYIWADMPEAIRQEINRHIVTECSDDGLTVTRRISDEGWRVIADWQKSVRDAWQPDDISEANQWPEPLRTVISFRLLVSQYVSLSGNSMNELRNHWKRGRLSDLFLPMVDDVAAAMVATNEDPKGLYRAISLCNEADQMRFVESWRGEVLPAIRVVEIKLKNSTSGAATTNGEAPTTNKKPEVITAPAVVAGATVGREHTSEGDRLDKITKDCWRKAYLAHQYAEMKQDRELNDREAWEYLNEHGIGDDGDNLESYEVPLKHTYGDYMYNARRCLNELKYTPRGGRAAGSRSVQKRSEI